MSHRNVPCGVCRSPLIVLSRGPFEPGAPELLSGRDLWFGILQPETGAPGMIVLCSEACALQLAHGTPVLIDDKNVGQA